MTVRSPLISLPRIFLLVLASLWLATPAFAQYGQPAKFPKTGKVNTDFIPEGWGASLMASGDLNGDNIPDEVIVVDHNQDPDMSSEAEYDRVLIVLFGKSNGNYSLAAKSTDVLLCATCDGGKDSVKALRIERGAIVLEQSSRPLQGTTAQLTLRFRYQDGDFFMIGKTLTKKGYKADYNLSTGKKVVEEGGKTSTIQAKLPLTPLSNAISQVELAAF